MPWDRSELRVGRLEAAPSSEWTTVAGGQSSHRCSRSGSTTRTSSTRTTPPDDGTSGASISRPISSAAPSRPPTPTPAARCGCSARGGSRRLDDGRIVAIRTHGDDAARAHPRGRHGAAPARHGDLGGLRRGCARDARARVRSSSPTRPADCGSWTSTDRRAPRSSTVEHRPGAPNGCRSHARSASTGLGGPVHAYDFPPTNPDASAPADELPPYIVCVHGGPTAHRGGAASGRVAYFTSRGNRRAGRELRRLQRLRPRVPGEAARAVGRGGRRGRRRRRVWAWPPAGPRIPRGSRSRAGPPGGWTVLASLVNTDAFAAGMSRYGVGDARALATDTHDFEARYLDGLIGPLPAAEQLYLERSPLSHPERFRVPLLLLQGADDRVVPPAQSEAIRDALAARGIPHAYVALRGRGTRIPPRRERRARAGDRTRLPRRGLRLRHPGHRSARRSAESRSQTANGASSAARRSETCACSAVPSSSCVCERM